MRLSTFWVVTVAVSFAAAVPAGAGTIRSAGERVASGIQSRDIADRISQLEVCLAEHPCAAGAPYGDEASDRRESHRTARAYTSPFSYPILWTPPVYVSEYHPDRPHHVEGSGPGGFGGGDFHPGHTPSSGGTWPGRDHDSDDGPGQQQGTPGDPAPAAVPEPATFLFGAAGLAAVLLKRRIA